jgi:hypothetical protein
LNERFLFAYNAVTVLWGGSWCSLVARNMLSHRQKITKPRFIDHTTELAISVFSLFTCYGGQPGGRGRYSDYATGGTIRGLNPGGWTKRCLFFPNRPDGLCDRPRLLLVGHRCYFTETVPVAARSKEWVCGRSLAETAGSNPAGGMDVCLL